MIEQASGQTFVKEGVCRAVEAVTRAYFAANPDSLERLDKVIAVEDALSFANLMGVTYNDIVRAYLRGTPKKYQQDYLDTIYDQGFLFGNGASQIAREFGLTSPTLGI